MKKQLIFALALAAIPAFTGIAAEAADKQAAALYGTAVIDGTMDEAYKSVTPIATDVRVAGYDSTTGSKANVWVLWDYDGLNVYAEVDEKTPNDNGYSDAYNVDSIEIFIDENNSKSETLDSDDAQYRVTMKGRSETGMNGKATFASATKIDGEKYIVEMKVPWQGIIPGDGMVIGFNAAVNDGQANATRDCVMQWSSDSARCYRDTSIYGELTLLNGDGYEPYNGTNRSLKIALNGKMVQSDVPPVVVDERTLVPMRVLFEAFDMEISWIDSIKTVYAIGDGILFEIPIGSSEVKVNKQPVTLDVPASIIDGRTLVPVRFVAETLGLTVEYDGYKGIIYITGNI